MSFFISLLLLFSSLIELHQETPHTTSDKTEQTEASVEETVNEFFNAMRKSDGAGMEKFLMAGATLHTVTSSDEENPMLRETALDAFLNSVSEAEPGALDEQLTSFTSHVDGDLSTAWMGYNFYYNGEFSHCGINTMNLLNTATGWKIFSIVDTRRQQGCDA